MRPSAHAAGLLVFSLGLAACATAPPALEPIAIRMPGEMGPRSSGIARGGTLWISARLGVLPGSDEIVAGEVREEARQALENLAAVVGRAGYGLEEVVSCTVYLTDPSQKTPVDEVFREFFRSPHPARTTVFVSSLPLGGRVQISGVAVKGRP